MATQTEKILVARAKSSTVQSPATAGAADVAPPRHVPNSIIGRTPDFIEPERRTAMIAEAAYYRAEHRGFESGYELEDWLEAENEIDGMLTRGEIPLACGV